MRTTGRPVPFVDDKRADLARIGELLALSEKETQWTNGGPVWRLLKVRMEEALALPAGRAAVPCASGTHALFAAAAVLSARGALRWGVPAYGFRATVLGPFSGCRILPVDERGELDLDRMSAPALSQLDAVLYMNPFGLTPDAEPWIRRCRAEGRKLLIDNAHGFGAFARADHAGVMEAISFHHTKPYGFGEGGCLILDTADEALALQALNFGYHAREAMAPAALGNGKMSDIAAAFILAHHEKAAGWAPGFAEQFGRIAALGKEAGFDVLRHPAPGAIPSSVPLLAPLHAALVANPYAVLQKYYPPLDENSPEAARLYRRIVNVPCHGGMAALSDGDLAQLLKGIRQ